MTNIEGTSKMSVETTGSGDNHQKDHPDNHILSNETRQVLGIIFYTGLNGPIGVLGSASNVINIVIFFKQGFSDSVNISLCALAVSDLGSILTAIWVSICFNPLFHHSDIGFDSLQVQYITGGLPHSCFARITSWITAFITFERCVCIAIPMKVKDIITPRRTFISVVAMFLIIFVTFSPLFSSIYFSQSFHTATNKTLVGLSYTSNAEALRSVSFSFNVFEQLTSFIIVIICTVILILKLLAKSNWRHNAISLSIYSDSISSRDKKVMKMVTFISIIFITCYLPTTINLILMVHFSSEYSVKGRYGNSYTVSWAIINTIEVINSSVNILVYYKMSSKFKTSFNRLFFTSTISDVPI